MKIIFLAGIALLISGCAESERCWKNLDPAVDVAFGKFLSTKGIKFKLDQQRGVCVPIENASALDEAHRRINEYGAEVATLASDDCELRHLTEWAKRENLAYQISPSTKSDGTPGGNMFIVRSLTAEEVALNRQKLREESPKVKRCK
jgi:hypothetical protein